MRRSELRNHWKEKKSADKDIMGMSQRLYTISMSRGPQTKCLREIWAIMSNDFKVIFAPEKPDK